MEQLIITAKNIQVGDVILFPNGEHNLDLFQINNLERVIAVGVDPNVNQVEIHSQVGAYTIISAGIPGNIILKVYREGSEKTNATINQN